MTDEKTLGEITGMTEKELRLRVDEAMKGYVPPNNEQLARFALLKAYGPAPRSAHELEVAIVMFVTDEELRQQWLQVHREFQEDIHLTAIAIEYTNDEMVDKLNG